MSNLVVTTPQTTQPMSILSKDTIEKEILIHLSISNKGPKMEVSQLVGILQLIFHRLKTGTQWRELPVKQYLDDDYKWNSVFHHFNKWSKDGSWRRLWLHHLRTKKQVLDLSTAQLDGTHTRCKRGGEAADYQQRKSAVTSNMLCISDNQGILIAASQPEAGNHHDTFDFETHFEELVQMLTEAEIEAEGLFLNADAGFDTQQVRAICHQYGIIPNFAFNPRNGSQWDREDYFDELLYKRRLVIEHAFAWLDAYKALLIRYETTTRNWFSLNMLGFTTCLIRKTAKLL